MNRRRFLTLLSVCLVLLFVQLSSPAAWAQSYTLTASPQSLTVYPGQTGVPVTVSVASTTYSGPVDITLSGLPSGITVSPSPLTIQPGASGTLMLNVAPNASQEAFVATAPNNPTSTKSTINVVGSVGSTSVTSSLSLTVSISNAAFVPSQVNLPVVRIDTAGTPVTSTDIDVPGNITITSADGSVTYIPNSSDTDTTATFHVHGNSTAAMPKKAYTVSLNTSLDLLNQMGLSCPYVTSGKAKPTCDKSKHYVLLANYDDKTLLRDWSASALANAIPYGNGYLDETPVPAPYTGVIPTPSGTAARMPWASHSLFVEVYLNGVYEGNYQLIEGVRVDSHRVNITELAETDTGSGADDITGGYLLEIDGRQDQAFTFVTPQNVKMGLIDPDFTPDPEVPQQTSYISNYVDTAETVLFSSAFTDPVNGWRAYFDEASAVNFYLVNDIMGNVDGGDFFSSDYVYKAVDNPFLYMGPVWDFDISSGNVSYASIIDPAVPWMQTQAPWYVQWFKDPGFKADVATQFNALKNNGVFATWLASIKNQAASLEVSQANNFARWPIIGERVWPNVEAAGNYDDEVAYLTNYLSTRIAYLDSVLNGKKGTTTTLNGPSGNLYLNAPETYSATVNLAQSPSGTVTFLCGNTIIGTSQIGSNNTAVFTATNLRLGTNTIQAEYNGDTVNALSKSNRISVTVVEPPAATVTSLAGPTTTLASGATANFSVSVVGNSGTAAPTGTVAFSTSGNLLGTSTLSSGTANFATASLTVGTNSVLATYSGDSSYKASASSAVQVIVGGSAVIVNVGTSPNGLAYMVDGVLYNSSQALNLVPGSTHMLSVPSPQVNGGQRNTFAGWSDGGAQSHTIIVPDAGGAYSVAFTTEYLLTLAVTPTGSGAISETPASADGYYSASTLVTLNEAPNSGYSFNGWTGSVSDPTAPSSTVTMSSPQSISASFVPNGGTNYGNGFTTSGLKLNGSAIVNSGALQLTSKSFTAGSAYGTLPVNVQAFTNDFTFQLPAPVSDGLTFVLQNQAINALGSYGSSLGYQGITKSVAIKFDLHNNAGEGTDSTGLYSGGAAPTVPAVDMTSSGVSLLNGNPLKVHMTYDGTTLLVTVTDTVTSKTANQSYTVNIPSLVGANTAFAGFTAGAGTSNALQSVLNWTFVPTAPAAVAAPTFSPGGGVIYGPQSVMLADATQGASIYYTLDGTPPTTNSSLYSGPFQVAATTTVNAIAATAAATSQVATAVYTLGNIAAPSISPAGGPFNTPQQVTLTDATQGASIYYTLDGSTPTTGSSLYTAPFTVSTTTTVNAIASISGAVSPVTSASFVLSSFAIDYSQGFTTTGLKLNGASSINAGKLQLTNKVFISGTAYATSAVNVQSFTNDFTFQLPVPVSDGITFLLQNQAITAVGSYGSGLGYQGIAKSVAIKFDLHNNSGEGSDSTGLFSGGAAPTVPAIDMTPSGVSLQSGNPFHVHMTYDGTTLAVSITDTVTGKVAAQSYTVNIPTLVGGNTAFAGFSAGTGTTAALQNVLAWTYSTP